MEKLLLLLPFLLVLIFILLQKKKNSNKKTTLYFTNGFDGNINDISYNSTKWTKTNGGYAPNTDTEEKKVNQLSGFVTVNYNDGVNAYQTVTCLVQNDEGDPVSKTVNLKTGKKNHYTLYLDK